MNRAAARPPARFYAGHQAEPGFPRDDRPALAVADVHRAGLANIVEEIAA